MLSPEEILENSEVRKYYENWEKPGDMTFVAIENKSDQSVGAKTACPGKRGLWLF